MDAAAGRAWSGTLTVVAMVLAVVVGPAVAARPPCAADTYTVQGGPLLPGAPAGQVDTIDVVPDPASVTLSIGCGAANERKPARVRGGKKGTKVRASWADCAGLVGKVKFRGLIVDACGRLTGRLKAKGLARSFEALGDGGSGTCDPLAAPGAQGCAAGEKCTWVVVQETPDLLGTLDCVPDGTAAAGGACTTGPAGDTTGFDDCAAGLICIGGTCQDVCPLDGSPGACADDGACTRYSGVFGSGSDDPVAGACTPSCNPLTQLQSNGDPCPLGQGCYLLVSQTETIAVCAGAGTLGHGELITGSAFANSCLPGHQPRRRDGVTQDLECGALCQPTDVYQGMNVADEGGVAPYTCAAAGASPPDDGVAGESCRYWWAREPFDTLSPFSNTVGWCFKHAVFQYDSNGDQVEDAPFPRCPVLTTGDVVPPIGNPPHNDAQYFWCAALPPPALAPATLRPPR
jgi:hypothetical protein